MVNSSSSFLNLIPLGSQSPNADPPSLPEPHSGSEERAIRFARTLQQAQNQRETPPTSRNRNVSDPSEHSRVHSESNDQSASAEDTSTSLSGDTEAEAEPVEKKRVKTDETLLAKPDTAFVTTPAVVPTTLLMAVAAPVPAAPAEQTKESTPNPANTPVVAPTPDNVAASLWMGTGAESLPSPDPVLAVVPQANGTAIPVTPLQTLESVSPVNAVTLAASQNQATGNPLSRNQTTQNLPGTSMDSHIGQTNPMSGVEWPPSAPSATVPVLSPQQTAPVIPATEPGTLSLAAAVPAPAIARPLAAPITTTTPSLTTERESVQPNATSAANPVADTSSPATAQPPAPVEALPATSVPATPPPVSPAAQALPATAPAVTVLPATAAQSPVSIEAQKASQEATALDKITEAQASEASSESSILTKSEGTSAAEKKTNLDHLDRLFATGTVRQTMANRLPSGGEKSPPSVVPAVTVPLTSPVGTSPFLLNESAESLQTAFVSTVEGTQTGSLQKTATPLLAQNQKEVLPSGIVLPQGTAQTVVAASGSAGDTASHTGQESRPQAETTHTEAAPVKASNSSTSFQAVAGGVEAERQSAVSRAEPVRAGIADRSLDRRALAEQVTRHLETMRLTNGRGEISLRLQPEYLGRLHVSISTHGEGVVARVMAETVQAQQAMEGSKDQLRTALESRGLHLQSLEISVGQQSVSDSQAGSGGLQSRQQELHRAAPTWGRAREARSTETDRISPLAARAEARAALDPASRLDYRA